MVLNVLLAEVLYDGAGVFYSIELQYDTGGQGPFREFGAAGRCTGLSPVLDVSLLESVVVDLGGILRVVSEGPAEVFSGIDRTGKEVIRDGGEPSRCDEDACEVHSACSGFCRWSRVLDAGVAGWVVGCAASGGEGHGGDECRTYRDPAVAGWSLGR